MKKIITLLLILNLPIILYSQTTRDEVNKFRDVIKRNGIKLQIEWSYEPTNSGFKQKGLINNYKVFDTSGNLVLSSFKDDSMFYFYSNNKLIEEIDISSRWVEGYLDREMRTFKYNEYCEVVGDIIYKNDSLEFQHIFNYDDKGKITEETLRYPNREDIRERYNNTYNNSGKLETVEHCWADGEVEYKEIRKYNDNNKISETETYYYGEHKGSSDYYKNTYEYDGNDNLIEEITYGGANYYEKINYKYDNNNQIEVVKEGYDKEHNSSLKSKQEYAFDVNNNLIEENDYNENGEKEKRVTLDYDNKGNIIEETEYRLIDKFQPFSQIKYTYEYFNKKNK